MLAAAVLLQPLPAAATGGQTGLTHLEQTIAAEHSDVHSLFPQQLERLLREGDDLLIFDVRDKAEFDISHVPGAVRIDPDMTAEQFMAAFGHTLGGRTVLLYCSVGVRSSRLAQRIDDAATDAGAVAVYNLRGGIFAWHNYGKSLKEGRQLTEHVHPYSRSWSRYLDFPEYARFRRDARR